jgi:MFS family permease
MTRAALPPPAFAKGLLLVLAQALPIMAVVSLFPAIPKLAQQFGGVPHADYLVPMIITLPSFGIAIFSPAFGWMTDRVGRRPLYLGALTLYAVMGLAPLFLKDLGMIVASRAALGLAEAGIVTVGGTLIADYFGEDRYRWLALQSGLGSVLGTLLIAVGGWLADASWRGAFAIYLVAIPLLVASAIMIDEPIAPSRYESHRTQGPFPWKIALLFGGVSLVTSALYYVEPTNIAALFQERGVQSTARIGLIQASTSIAYILGAYVYKRISHSGIAVQLAISCALIGAGMVGIGQSATWQTASFWALVQQLGGGMVIPALTGWAQGCVSFEQRGRAMGIWATFFFSGLFLCPSLVAWSKSGLGSLSLAFTFLGAASLGVALVAGCVKFTFRKVPS